MGSMSLWHWIIVALIVVLLFGRGRISDVMGELAKGIKSFKQGMAEDPAEDSGPPKQITHKPSGQPTTTDSTKDRSGPS